MRYLIQFLQDCFTSLKEIKKVWAEIFLKCDNYYYYYYRVRR